MKSVIPVRPSTPGVLLTAVLAAGIMLADIWLPGGTAAAGIEVGRLLAARRPAVGFLDAGGGIVGMLPGGDGEWRMELPGRVPERAAKYFMAVEDWRFYEHCGVDPLASLRAMRQNLFSRRIVSGASTITMQLARSLDYRGRSWRVKFSETLRALALERHFTKAGIMRLYLDNLPFGGRIYGLETASRYYFGCGADELSDSEMALLAGIPQRPNGLRPDRHPVEAAARRDVVLELLELHGVISGRRRAELSGTPPVLRRGDFNASEVMKRLQSRHYCAMALRQAGDVRNQVRTCLEPAVQEAVLRTAVDWLAGLDDVNDCAAVVIDNRTMAVTACLGGTDFDSADAGNVNSAVAKRIPGSVLKPFVYGAAVSRGLLLPETVFYDGARNFSGYRPENADRGFNGYVTAGEALASSLNIPAVEVLAMVGVKEWLDELEKFGIVSSGREKTGLSAVLGGGVEVSPLELAAACAGIASGGIYRPPRLADLPREPGRRVWSPATAYMVNRMLRREMPGAPGLDVAWKTGTSQGRRDAWCAAWTPDFTVAVWLGNKNGAPAACLVGAEAAAPLAGRIMTVVSGGRRADWPEAGECGVAPGRLCGISGLRPSPECGEVFIGEMITGNTLRVCRSCGGPGESRTGPRLLSPASGTVLAGADGRAEVLCRAVVPDGGGTAPRVLWYCDGEFAGSEPEWVWSAAPGRHRIGVYFPGSGERHDINLSVEISDR